MDTQERVAELERKVRGLSLVLLAGPVVFFCLGVGAMDLTNAVFGRVRARTYEVFDKDRGGVVIDVEKSIEGLRSSIERSDASLSQLRDMAQRAYTVSGAEASDQLAAQRAAEAKAQREAAEQMARELAAIRSEIERARLQAKNDEERKRMDAWSQSITDQMNADKLRSEISRIRREMERGW